MARIFGDSNDATGELALITEGVGKPLIPVDDRSDLAAGVVLAVRGGEYTSQTPTGTDAPMQVTFGAAQTTEYASLAADGSFTLATNGAHILSAVLPVVRDTNAGVSLSFFRLTANGAQYGDIAGVRINNSDTTIPFQFIVTLPDTSVAGVVYAVEMVRDSTGVNNGELVSETSTLWGAAPSAQLSIFKYI